MAGQAIVTIREKQWTVSLAMTPYELASGLGNIPQIPPRTGMLFDLGTARTVQVTTVPMLFSLDIAFLSETLVITEVYRDVEPGYLITSTIPARYFLEVNAGELEGIDAGDRMSMEVIVPAQAAAPDWVAAFFGFIGLLVAGILTVSLVKELVKGLLEEPEKPVLLAHVEPEGEVKVVITPETGGYDVSAIDSSGQKIRTAWGYDRSDALRKATAMADFYRDYHHQPAKIEWVTPQEKMTQAAVRVVLSSLISEELSAAGLGYVAKDVSRAVEERCQFSDWLELWDGTTFERSKPYRGMGVTIPRLVVAEIGIRTGLTYNECVAIGERIDAKLKGVESIVLDDGTVFRKSFVPVKKAASVVPDKSKAKLAQEILKGLSGKEEYRAYVRYPRDKSAFVTIGAIIGGHYSWNPAGFTIWVDAWERNPEWPPDHILAIKELRRPRTFEATEEGVRKALEYVETEFPSFTETLWGSKSIPIYVAHELGIMKKEAAPEWLPGVVVMPKIPEEARKDPLFVQYLHDLVRLGERITDEEVRIMWEAWKKRELSRLPHAELIKKQKEIARPAVTPVNRRSRREGELEFLPDSPEFLAYTIDDIGYRERIDSAFQQAISRAQRSEPWP